MALMNYEEITDLIDEAESVLAETGAPGAELRYLPACGKVEISPKHLRLLIGNLL